MNTDSILQIGNPALTGKANPIQITKITSKENKKIYSELLGFLKKQKLQSLSTPIFDIKKRIIIIRKNKKPILLINPVVFEKSKTEYNYWENCLCINHGKLWGLVPRYQWIEIVGHLKSGRRVSLKLTGKTAADFQHQREHLEGNFFTQRIQKTNLEFLVGENEYKKFKTKLPKPGKVKQIHL